MGLHPSNIWLLLFYVLATSKFISGQLPTLRALRSSPYRPPRRRFSSCRTSCRRAPRPAGARCWQQARSGPTWRRAAERTWRLQWSPRPCRAAGGITSDQCVSNDSRNHLGHKFWCRWICQMTAKLISDAILKGVKFVSNDSKIDHSIHFWHGYVYVKWH